MLTRLIYASEISTPLTSSAVQEIVDKARHANQRRHLTGMLAFDSRSFLQALEGPRDMVSELFARSPQTPVTSACSCWKWCRSTSASSRPGPWALQPPMRKATRPTCAIHAATGSSPC